MKIGILGSGQVAQTLGAGLLRHGHQITLGSSEPAKLQDWAAANPGGKAATFRETAVWADLVIVAVKGTASENVIELAGGNAVLAGKTVIDASNPTADAPPVNGVLSAFTGRNESLMERLQSLAPDAHFVKAFNTVGLMHFIDPKFEGGPATMLICGNEDSAKQQVLALLAEVGWAGYDWGQVEAARALESFAILWCIPGIGRNQWDHAFRLVHAVK